MTIGCERILRTIALSGFWLALFSMNAEAKTKVTSEPFGKTPDGTPVEIFTLNDGAYEARIGTYGGIVVSLKVPDRDGKAADVVLGFDNLDGYVSNFNGPSDAFFGALIGRYANRIAHGSFSLDGKKYSLPLNNGENSLHGGPHGFNNVVWKAKPIANGVELTYLSKDGEAGYPGNLSATVRYTLVKGDLRIEYSATTDKDTVVNLTNPSYFNLPGQGDILNDGMFMNPCPMRFSESWKMACSARPSTSSASSDCSMASAMAFCDRLMRPRSSALLRTMRT